MISNGGWQIGRQVRVAAVALLLMVGVLASGVHVGPLPGTQPASAATQLGGLNLNNFCMSKWGGTAVNRWPYNAGTWTCRTAAYTGSYPWSVSVTYQFYGIDTNEACRYQYGGGAWSASSNWSDPYSWRCYR